MKKRLYAFTLALFLFIATTQAQTQSPAIVIDPSNIELIGATGDAITSELSAVVLNGTASAITIKTSTVKLTLVPSGKPEDCVGTLKFNTSSFTVNVSSSSTTLPSGATGFQVSGTLPKGPGLYCGSVMVNATTKVGDKTVNVSPRNLSLRVHVAAIPNLQLPEGVEFKPGITKCSAALCWLGFLAGNEGSALKVVRPVPLRDANDGDFSLEETIGSVLSRTNSSGSSTLPQDVVFFDCDPGRCAPKLTGKNGVLNVPIAFDAEHIPAGSYTGSIMLKINGFPIKQEIKTVLNVRNAPGLPITLLLLGVVFGQIMVRLAKYVESDGYKAVVEARILGNQIRGTFSNILSDDTNVPLRREAYRRFLDWVSDLERSTTYSKDADVKIEQTKLTDAWKLYQDIADEYAKAITNPLADATQQARKTLLEDAASNAINNNLEKAKKDLEAARKMAAPVVVLAVPASTNCPCPAVPDKPTVEKLTWFWSFLGISALEPLRGLRAFVLLAGVFVLASTGFIVNYLTNLTFGAEAFRDYFAMIAWGFSSTITGKAISDALGSAFSWNQAGKIG